MKKIKGVFITVFVFVFNFFNAAFVGAEIMAKPPRNIKSTPGTRKVDLRAGKPIPATEVDMNNEAKVFPKVEMNLKEEVYPKVEMNLKEEVFPKVELNDKAETMEVNEGKMENNVMDPAYGKIHPAANVFKSPSSKNDPYGLNQGYGKVEGKMDMFDDLNNPGSGMDMFSGDNYLDGKGEDLIP